MDRIHGEMRAIKDKVGFEGDLQAFFKFMRDDSQFLLLKTNEQDRERYINEATALINNMKANLDKIFITKPKADLKVKAVEAFKGKICRQGFLPTPCSRWF